MCGFNLVSTRGYCAVLIAGSVSAVFSPLNVGLCAELIAVPYFTVVFLLVSFVVSPLLLKALTLAVASLCRFS